MGEEETRVDPKCDNKRARFMNNILPLFYKSMYPFFKNAREFVKRFHDQGRHDAECRLERLEKTIDVVMDPNNPSVAGKYFSEDQVFTRSDLPILQNNLKMVQDIKTSIQKQEEEAKKHLPTNFSKAGKLLPGHNHPKTFVENFIGKVIKVKERVIEIVESLTEKFEKTSNMFQDAPYVNAKTKKRSQKENRRKAKRRKVSRKSTDHIQNDKQRIAD